jgi:hypothetical protein
MSPKEFHANVWANVIGGIVFAALVWAYVKRHGGHCPVCGQRQP